MENYQTTIKKYDDTIAAYNNLQKKVSEKLLNNKTNSNIIADCLTLNKNSKLEIKYSDYKKEYKTKPNVYLTVNSLEVIFEEDSGTVIQDSVFTHTKDSIVIDSLSPSTTDSGTKFCFLVTDNFQN